MGLWGSVCICFILCLLVTPSWGQNPGDDCRRLDGTRGVCRDAKNCVDGQGQIESATKLSLCRSSTFNSIIVCCRKTPEIIVQQKCNQWKRQANQDGSTCTVTIPLARGGTEAAVGEFPHIVSLLVPAPNDRISHVCGGMLISKTFVLTAAHCIIQGDLFVRIGGHDHRGLEEGITFDSRVLDKIIHPEYQPPRRYNDIALLRLAREVPFTRRVRPACLPHRKERILPGTKLIVAGWGSYENGGPTSDVLRKAEVTSVDRFRCDKNPVLSSLGTLLQYPVGITDSIICADETRGGACQGDSGGPLMEVTSTTCEVKEVVGLVSRGIGECRSTSVPGTYTRIEYYLDWIVRTVWPDEL